MCMFIQTHNTCTYIIEELISYIINQTCFICFFKVISTTSYSELIHELLFHTCGLTMHSVLFWRYLKRNPFHLNAKKCAFPEQLICFQKYCELRCLSGFSFYISYQKAQGQMCGLVASTQVTVLGILSLLFFNFLNPCFNSTNWILCIFEKHIKYAT